MYLIEALAVLVKDWQEKLKNEEKNEEAKIPMDENIQILGGKMPRWIIHDLTPVQVADLIMGYLEKVGMIEVAGERVGEFQTSVDLLSDSNLSDFLGEMRAEKSKDGPYFRDRRQVEVV